MGGFSVFIGSVFYFAIHHNLKSQNEIQSTTTTIVQQKEELQYASQTDAGNKTTIENNTTESETNLEKETSTNQIQVASAQEVSETKNKKEDYYFQGDAKINFENEGANVNMVIGDELKRLEINGKVINENEYPKYEALIQKGKALKAEADLSSSAKTDAEKNQQQKNREVMNELIKQLQNDKMIDEVGHFEFRITGSKLFINNNEQREAMFTQYKNLYETVSGNRLNAKSNVRIKH